MINVMFTFNFHLENYILYNTVFIVFTEGAFCLIYGCCYMYDDTQCTNRQTRKVFSNQYDRLMGFYNGFMSFFL